MLSRFFQKEQQDVKPQTTGLGDIDALDGAMNDPRQSPSRAAAPQSNQPTNTTDDDDDESAMDMSFMNSPSDDDERTVDTTNSGMLMDMVKNNFLQGLTDEQQQNLGDDTTNSNADDTTNNDQSYEDADGNSYDDNDCDDDLSGSYSLDEDEDVNDDEGENDEDDENTPAQPRWGGRWLASSAGNTNNRRSEQDEGETDDSKRRRGWFRGKNAEESTNDDNDNDEEPSENAETKPAIVSPRRLVRLWGGRGNGDETNEQDPSNQQQQQEATTTEEGKENHDSDHSSKDDVVEVDDDEDDGDDDHSKMSSDAEPIPPPQSRFGWASALRPALVKPPEETTPSARRRRWGLNNKGENSENEVAADSSSEASETPNSASRRRWGWNNRSDASQRSETTANGDEDDKQNVSANDSENAADEPVETEQNMDTEPVENDVELNHHQTQPCNNAIDDKSKESRHTDDDGSLEQQEQFPGKDVADGVLGQRSREAVDTKASADEIKVEVTEDTAVRRSSWFSNVSSVASLMKTAKPAAESGSKVGDGPPANISFDSAGDQPSAQRAESVSTETKTEAAKSSWPSSSSTTGSVRSLMSMAQSGSVRSLLSGSNEGDKSPKSIFGGSKHSTGSARSIFGESKGSNGSAGALFNMTGSVFGTKKPNDEKAVAGNSKVLSLAGQNSAAEEYECSDEGDDSQASPVNQNFADSSEHSNVIVSTSAMEDNEVGASKVERANDVSKGATIGGPGAVNLSGTGNENSSVPPLSAESDITANETDFDDKQSRKESIDARVDSKRLDVLDESTNTAENQTAVDNKRTQLKKQKSWFDVVLGGDNDEANDHEDEAVAETQVQSNGTKGWFDSILGNPKESSTATVSNKRDEMPNAPTKDSSKEATTTPNANDPKETNRRSELVRSKSWIESVFVGESENSAQEPTKKSSNPAGKTETSHDSALAGTDRRKEFTRSKSWLESVFTGETEDEVAPDYVTKSSDARKEEPRPSIVSSNTKIAQTEVQEPPGVLSKDNIRSMSSSMPEGDSRVEDIDFGSVEASAENEKRASLKKSKSWFENVIGGEDANSNELDQTSVENVDRRATLTRSKSWLESVFSEENGAVNDDHTALEKRIDSSKDIGDRRNEMKRSKSWLETVLTGDADSVEMTSDRGPASSAENGTVSDDNIGLGKSADSGRSEMKRSKSWLETVLTGDADSPEVTGSHEPVFSGEKGTVNDDHITLEKSTESRHSEIKRSKSWLETVIVGDEDSAKMKGTLEKCALVGTKIPDDSNALSKEDSNALSKEDSNALSKEDSNALSKEDLLLPASTNSKPPTKSSEELPRSQSWLDGVLSQSDQKVDKSQQSGDCDRRSELKRSKSWIESVFDSDERNASQQASEEKRREGQLSGMNSSASNDVIASSGKVNGSIKPSEEFQTSESGGRGLSIDSKISEAAIDRREGLQRSKSWLESVLSGDDHQSTQGASDSRPRREDFKRSQSWLSLVLGDEADETPEYLKKSDLNDGKNNASGPDVEEELSNSPQFRFQKSHRHIRAASEDEKGAEGLDGDVSSGDAPQPRQLTRSKSWLDAMLGDEGLKQDDTEKPNPNKEAKQPHSSSEEKRQEIERSKSWYESLVGDDAQRKGNSGEEDSSRAHQNPQNWLGSVFGPEGGSSKTQNIPVRGVARTATSKLADDLQRKLQTVEHDEDERDQSMKKMFTEDEPVEIKLTRIPSKLSRSSSKGTLGDALKPDAGLTERNCSSHDTDMQENIHHTISVTNDKGNVSQKQEKSTFAKRALFQAISFSSYKGPEAPYGVRYSSKLVDLKGLSIAKAIFGDSLETDNGMPKHEDFMNEVSMNVSDDDIPDYLRDPNPTTDNNDMPETENPQTNTDEDHEQSEDSDSESESSGNVKSEGGKESINLGTITVNKAPLLRLRNVTQATREQLPDSKNDKATSRWKKWFGGKKLAHQSTEKDPIEEDIIESEPSEESSSELESEHSVSNGVVEPEDEIKEVMPSVVEESSSESTEEPDESPKNASATPSSGQDIVGGQAVANDLADSGNGITQSSGNQPTPSSNAKELSQTAATLLQGLTPDDIEKIAGKISAQSTTKKAVSPMKAEKKTLSPKRRKKKSISSLLEMNSSARQVGRHGDEVSVGTMNIKKKPVQSGRLVMVAKTNALVFDEQSQYGHQSKRRPWEMAMQKGPKKQIHETDQDDDDELKKIEILAKSEEFFGCGPGNLDNQLPVLAETVEESEEDSEESDVDETIADQTQNRCESTEEDFTEVWDNASCDESIAKAFMRSQQKKNHEKEKKRQKRELIKQERANATKRLRLFERSKDSRRTNRGAKKSKLSEEFKNAIHRVFEERSDGSLGSASDDSGSQDSLGSSYAGSCKSIFLDERVEGEGMNEDASVGTRSESSGDEHSRQFSNSSESLGETNDNTSGPHLKSSRKKKKQKRKASSRSEADASEMFIREIERLQAPKVLTIQTLRQEMIDRRGTSVNLLKKEYVTFKKKRSEQKFGADDSEEVKPIDFGALSTVPRRRSSYGAANNEDKSKDDEKSLPGVGLAEKLSRWASAEGVTELDDLATVTQSPTKTVNMFGVSNSNLKAAPALTSPNKDLTTPRGNKTYGTTRPTSRSGARTASTGARGAPRRRSSDSGALSGVSLDRPTVSTAGLDNPPAQMFTATFNDIPLNSIQEGSDNDEDFGLLQNLRKDDDDDDDQSYFSTASSKKASSNRFGLGAKVGQKMKRLVPKIPSMKASRNRSGGGSGFMLSDNDW